MELSASNDFLPLPSPDVLQVKVNVATCVFDVNGHVGRLKLLHGELLWKSGDKESPQGLFAADLRRHANLLCLVSILKVEHTWTGNRIQSRQRTSIIVTVRR